MYLVGSRGQQVPDRTFDASGTITAGGTPQLVLPEMRQRAMLVLQNLSSGPLYFEFGSARATATLTNGVVTSVTITNAGFNFTIPPHVEFLGGGNPTNSTFLGCGQYGSDAPSNPAKGQAVLSGGSVASVTINNGGSKYKTAPYVWIYNSHNDPFGCADPSLGSPAGSGILLAASGGSYFIDGTTCPTDAIAVYGASTGQKFTCKYMP